MHRLRRRLGGKSGGDFSAFRPGQIGLQQIHTRQHVCRIEVVLGTADMEKPNGIHATVFEHRNREAPGFLFDQFPTAATTGPPGRRALHPHQARQATVFDAGFRQRQKRVGAGHATFRSFKGREHRLGAHQRSASQVKPIGGFAVAKGIVHTLAETLRSLCDLAAAAAASTATATGFFDTVGHAKLNRARGVAGKFQGLLLGICPRRGPETLRIRGGQRANNAP